MNKDFIKNLKKIKDIKILDSFEDRVVNSFDATDDNYLPDLIVEPHTKYAVSEVVKLCSEFKIPVVPKGAGCGFSGGVLNTEGGISLNLSFLKEISIDKENLVAEVEPGVITVDIDAMAKEFGLFYPPDPSSLKISTIGGNIAENAGGPRAVKYGVTGDYVLALEVVLPDGTINIFGTPLKKDVAGYNMTPLFVGSEGTLGVVVRAWLKLLPRPESTLSGMFFFDSAVNAGKAIASIVSSGLTPSKLEIMDEFCLKALKEAGHNIESNAKAVLLIEVDGKEKYLKEDLKLIENSVLKFGLTDSFISLNSLENERIWNLRRSLSPIINTFGNTKMNEDVVVKRSDIPKLFAFIKELREKYNLNIVCFGHAGDGNIHVNYMFNKEDKNIIASVEKALDEMFKKIISLGGSISGEHGIGIAKKRFMTYQFSNEQINLMKKFKTVFDPQNIMNPGKILPEIDYS